jgi:hypothetical protein
MRAQKADGLRCSLLAWFAWHEGAFLEKRLSLFSTWHCALYDCVLIQSIFSSPVRSMHKIVLTYNNIFGVGIIVWISRHTAGRWMITLNLIGRPSWRTRIRKLPGETESHILGVMHGRYASTSRFLRMFFLLNPGFVFAIYYLVPWPFLRNLQNL